MAVSSLSASSRSDGPEAAHPASSNPSTTPQRLTSCMAPLLGRKGPAPRLLGSQGNGTLQVLGPPTDSGSQLGHSTDM